MSALPGGAADKIGNRYEFWWTVWELVRLLHGQSESIRIEDPGVMKAEFVVSASGRHVLHQAKCSNPNGKWTLNGLGATGTDILQAIFDQLVGNDACFVFVSGSHAEELDTLSDRARQSDTLTEFEQHFVGAAKHAKSFERLRGFWRETDAATAYDVLKRVDVRTISEKDIREMVLFAIPSLFIAAPERVASELLSVVQDSVHKVITRDELLSTLACRGFHLRHLRHVEDAPALIEKVTQDYLATVRKKLIRSNLIARDSTQRLVELITTLGRGSESVLIGKAGSGKTGCVIGLIDEARKHDMAVLAMRLDRINPVKTTHELGDELGLEDSPALVLAAASDGRPALLVIDQLDAVSMVSGRGIDFLDAVHGLLVEARGLQLRTELHVVLVCRGFDWENDHRLRSIVTEQHTKVDVAEFPLDEVKRILGTAGFDASLFVAQQLELLRLPQNLALFLEAGFDASKTPRFNTAKELFDRYWVEKRACVNARTERLPDQWNSVIRLLCDHMGRAQQLSVLREVLDPYEGYVACMASEGVLTIDGHRCGFGHESFFDYCFARTFIAGATSLVDFLADSEQHLFRRAQVRQVLTYLRDANRERYCHELGILLSDERVRPHLKELSLALVAAVPDPVEDEWAVIEPWINSELAAFERGERNPDRLASLVWLHIFRASSWFAFLDSQGFVEGWLASDVERIVDMGVQYLRAHERRVPDRVAELLEPYVGAEGTWPDRLKYVIQWADHGKSRRLFELLLRLVDDGTLDDARGPIAVNSTFWSMFHGMGRAQPAWVGELLAHWMRRRRVLIGAARDEAGRIPWRELFNHDNFGRDELHQGADCAPLAFVSHVMPVVLDLSVEAVYGEDTELPRRDSIWPFLRKTTHESVDAAVITALACALRKCAEDAGSDLSAFIHRLRAQNTFIANVLLLVLYTHGADRFADEAARLICEEPWRLHCGYTDSPYWIAMQFIRAIVPHCSSETRGGLESAVLAYTPEYERRGQGHKHSGYARFSLLSCFGRDCLSSQGQARLGELERKFGAPQSGPEGMRAFTVKSPIEKEGAELMTDEQWLRAIAKYDSEERQDRWRTPEKGGAWELASMLSEFTKSDPERFALLCLQLPASTNPIYFTRLLDGLKDSETDTTFKLDVCRKVFSEHRLECGRSLADLLGSVDDTLPDDAVDMLAWLGTEHPDPVMMPDTENSSGESGAGFGDVYTHGINSARGRAAEAITALIWRDRGYIDRFRSTIDRLAGDDHGAVLACAASLFHAAAPHDFTWALELFSRAVESDERVLQAPGVEPLLHYGIRYHFSDVRAYVERMLRAEDNGVAQAGARLAALAVLYARPAEELVAEALQGGGSQRLGIAQVAAQNIGADECREWCEEQLVRLFSDSDARVRSEAGSCFRQLVDSPLGSYEQLIQTFCESAAYADDTFSIFHLLEESVHRLPGVTCDVCEIFLNRFGDEAKDISTSRAGDIHTVAALVFRTYQQHQDDPWASRCLDLIDRMCIEGMGDARKGLDEFDR
jgi:hypothetical protein